MNLELTFDYDTGQTFLIDNLSGIQKQVKSNGEPLIQFQPNVTGFSRREGVLEKSNEKTSTCPRFYTPMNNKFYGYAQNPRTIIKADFLKSRIISRQPKRITSNKGLINSYNKPNTSQSTVRERKMKKRIDYRIDESSLNSSIQHLTASMKDSFHTLQKAEVQVEEQNQPIIYRDYNEIIHEDHEQLKKDLNQVQFTVKNINGNLIKSPQLGFLLQYYKKHKKGQKIPENQLPLIEIIKAFKNKKSGTKLFIKEKNVIKVEDQQIKEVKKKMPQKKKCESVNINLGTELNTYEKGIIERYFNTNQDSFIEPRSSHSENVSRLITQKMQDSKQKREKEMLEAYPENEYNKQHFRRIKNFESHIYTNHELYQKEKPLGLIFYMSKRLK